MKVLMQNVSKAPLAGKPVGATFKVEVRDDGLPAERAWRTHYIEGSIIRVAEPSAPEPPTTAPEKPAAAVSRAAKPKAAPAKQKD